MGKHYLKKQACDNRVR